MKLAVKKTYCSNCRRLVKGQEQILNKNLRHPVPEAWRGCLGSGWPFLEVC